MMLFGIDATGWECRTSLYRPFIRNPWRTLTLGTHPACVGIEKSPPDTIFANVPHFPATIEKHGKHTLAKIDDGDVFFRLGRLSRIVGHGMLFRYGGDHEGRM